MSLFNRITPLCLVGPSTWLIVIICMMTLLVIIFGYCLIRTYCFDQKRMKPKKNINITIKFESENFNKVHLKKEDEMTVEKVNSSARTPKGNKRRVEKGKSSLKVNYSKISQKTIRSTNSGLVKNDFDSSVIKQIDF